MAASVLQAQLLSWFKIFEATGGAPSGVNSPSAFEDLDQFLQLDGTTTPAVALFSVYKPTISGGGFTIDLTAAQGSNGNINATGKKLLAVQVANPAGSAGDVTISTGASNGYALAQPVKVKPGGFAMIYQAAALGAVDGTHKTLDVTATNGDVPYIGLLFG